MANYLTFAQLYAAVEQHVKQSGGRRDLAKLVINQVYLNEVLECDDLYPLHWLRAPITNKFHAPKTITDITAAAIGVITSAAHTFIGGEVISIWNTEGMDEINTDYTVFWSNIKLYVVVYINANTFSLQDIWGTVINTSAYTAYTGAGTILHHGWKLVGGISDIVKSVSDVSIWDGAPLTRIMWDDFFKNPDFYLKSDSGVPKDFLFVSMFGTEGDAYEFLLTFPGAVENKTAYIMIEAAGQRLSADDDVPLLPPQFHDAIISGAVVRLMESAAQVENAIVWPTIYTAQLAAIAAYNRKFYQQHETERRGKSYLL